MKSNDTTDLQQQIREAVFFMWEAEGRPADRSLKDYWLRAESKIRERAESKIRGRAAASMARRAVRVTFMIDGERIQVVNQEQLAMVVPPSADLEHDTPRTGFWYELQDSYGSPLYRRIMRNPLSRYVEVSTGDPAQPMAYQETERPSGVISIVVPDVAEGRSVALIASRPKSAEELSRDSHLLLVHDQIARFELSSEGVMP